LLSCNGMIALSSMGAIKRFGFVLYKMPMIGNSDQSGNISRNYKSEK
jgi:hypothetical protein